MVFPARAYAKLPGGLALCWAIQGCCSAYGRAVDLWEGAGTLNHTLHGVQAAIVFSLGRLNILFPPPHPPRRVPWSRLSNPAEPALSAGLEGHCSRCEQAVGKEEIMWQHREPMRLPSCPLKPQPKRERLHMINTRFLSLVHFRNST